MSKVKFQFPFLDRSGMRRTRTFRAEPDVTATVDPQAAGVATQTYPIDRLFHAVRRAASKLEFAKTPMQVWYESLLFTENRTKRLSRAKRFDIEDTTSVGWAPGLDINLSRAVANSWFLDHLLPMLLDGGGFRHSHAVIGAPGSGKSTLVKYLLSENAENIRRSKLVFSRFEFLKFLKEWRPVSPNINEALAAYMSFIQARDLVLAHFFQLENGCRFELKMPFRLERNLRDELEVLTNELEMLAGQVGLQPGPATRTLLQQTVAEAKLGNPELMTWLKNLSTKQRNLIIGTLWGDNCVVTIFDGLDSLRIEDAFRQSEEWSAVCHIIENRAALAIPVELRELGMARDCDSIVVIRNNTARYLESEYPMQGKSHGFTHFYELGNLDGLTAMVKVIERAIRLVPDITELSGAARQELVFETMRILQRTMLAIGRGHGASINGELVYDFFDGNLRQLFRFVSRLIHWSVQEMLKSHFLDTEDYFTDTGTLIRAVASDKGTQFLRVKSYRIVELLLFEESVCFENAASVLKSRSPMLNRGRQNGRIVKNEEFDGHIDNIFNYINVSPDCTVDAHALLEKVRVIQVLQNETISDADLGERLMQEFGYEPADLELLLRFLLKTDFISAEIVRENMDYDLRLRATTRGRLCVNSLLKNLGYLEHVFHRTLFPEELVRHVSDRPRSDKGRLEWAASSIRNAFILLTYLRHIEENPAGGRRVPGRYRLFETIQRNIVGSLERMTRPGAPPTGALEGTNQENDGPNIICRDAVKLILDTIECWHQDGTLAR